MLCQKCGVYVSDDEILCPNCGALLDRHEQDSGVRAIRQGRKGSAPTPSAAEKRTPHRRSGASRPNVEKSAETTSRVYVDAGVDGGVAPEMQAPVTFDAGMEPEARMPGMERYGRRTYGTGRGQTQLPGVHAPKRRKGVHKVSNHMINWAKMSIALAAAVVLLVVGAYFYITRTASGQRILARMGKDTTATALWEVGEEALDVGNIDQAITDFEKAREQDGEDNVNVDGLLLLGSAYEANGMVEEAMALYEDIYTNIVPTRPEAYRNMIRLLQAQDRDPEAAVLMQLAYEKTELTTFRNMRNELLPQSPVADLTAGLYSMKKELTLTSPQGYDIYYTLDANAVLPDEGTLYTEPIFLDEGIWDLRAVAVSDDLVSDELTGTYKIIMPSPQKPDCTLAPNTYKQRQRVRLRVGADNQMKKGEEYSKEKDITLYYTIDGSTPDADSPIYTDEAIVLPGGKVTLKAVAVNGYGKVSNALEVGYEILTGPFPLKSYVNTDLMANLTLGTTTRDAFVEKYGESQSTEEVTQEGFDAPCDKLIYPWGYAVIGKLRNKDVLVELYVTDGTISGPRSTAVGNSENDVVGQFRDMGQVESPSGNRGLYSNSYGTGKIYKLENGKEIRYVAKLDDGGVWNLTYELNSAGTVTGIRWQLVP